jgi:glycogen debranching enzyme
MSLAQIRPEQRYAWHGAVLLLTNTRGDCDDDLSLSGFYFRETRFLRTLRLLLNGEQPWLCEAAQSAPDMLQFVYVHPEPHSFGGGGSGAAGATTGCDASGIPYRALSIRVQLGVAITAIVVDVTIANHSVSPIELELGWDIGADYADLHEALASKRDQSAPVSAAINSAAQGCTVRYVYGHPRLPFQTCLIATGAGAWSASEGHIGTRLQLGPQESATLTLRVEAHDFETPITDDGARERDLAWRAWYNRLMRIGTPGNAVAEATIAANVRDMASFPLLDGASDEWLAMQAGVPLYPALFGRDALTAGWQAAMMDRAESLDATLAKLGRLQGTTVDDSRDEQPGRIVQQVRTGPLARLGLNPFARYYADYASPLMYVISLAQLYAWTGDRARLARHWDAARRVLDWARDHGDMDGDGYLEYRTLAPQGPSNQGWKDSGNAVLYEDGSSVRDPAGTCELQGYWFAAQQTFAVLCAAMDQRADGEAYWKSAHELRDRFNRDWWMEDAGFFALAMDRDKQLVRSIASNAGQCVTTGIIDDAHLPRVVQRLFAPDLFSGWMVRSLSANHVAYNPLAYHLGSIWAVENATIAFGLRRFGFDDRAIQLAGALFDLARQYPEYRLPECLGGFNRGHSHFPGAYPRSNTPQLWNSSVFPLLVHTLLGLQPVAPFDTLVFDPVLPTWLPEIVLHDLRIGGATATIRFWRDADGDSHGEVLEKRGTLHLVKQPPPESLTAGVGDRFGAFMDRVLHR